MMLAQWIVQDLERRTQYVYPIKIIVYNCLPFNRKFTNKLLNKCSILYACEKDKIINLVFGCDYLPTNITYA